MTGRLDRRLIRREAELRELSSAVRHGRISRREFLRRAATLGVAAGAAGALLGAGGTASAQEDTVSKESGAAGAESSENPRFGFVLSHEQFPTGELVDYAVLAEEAGFDMVWTSDHFHPWLDNEGHSMQPWLTNALIGQQTSRVLFGTGVTCPTYRYQPAAVAQAFASMGVQNPGRVFLGLGTGEALNEQAATGSFGPYQERADRLIEAVEIIRELWTGEWTDYEGSYYTVENARLYDVPEEPVPIYIAASGPKSARIAGEYGDGWILGAADIEKQELFDAFQEGAEAAGKDPETMPKILESFIVVGGQEEAEYAANLWRFTVDPWSDELLYESDPREIQRKAEEMYTLEEVYQNWPMGEDPEEHAQRMQDFLDQGATRIFVHSGQQDQQRVIDFYGSEVLPLLRS